MKKYFDFDRLAYLEIIDKISILYFFVIVQHIGTKIPHFFPTHRYIFKMTLLDIKTFSFFIPPMSIYGNRVGCAQKNRR